MFKSLTNMSTKLKMQNIGAEVSRALRFKSEGKEFRAVERANTACNMLKILADECGHNSPGEREFLFMAEELDDYMNGCVKYDTTAESIMKQYDIFNDITYSASTVPFQNISEMD